MASIKYKDNGTYKDIVVKVGDTLPIGAIIGFDTTGTIPDGWEYYAENQIRKIAPVTPANGNIKNSYGTSQTDTYSQDYLNGKIVVGTFEYELQKLKGQTEQNGTPTPNNPVTINVVKGNNTIKINNTDYSLNLGSIELCKINDYQDYIYKENDNWYKKSLIGKTTLNGSETWNMSETNYFTLLKNLDLIQANIETTGYLLSNLFEEYANTGLYTHDYGIGRYRATQTYNYEKIVIKNKDISSVNDFKTWLSSHNAIIYYVLTTATDTQITDTTLINQLNAIETNIKNAENVIQTNADLPIKIDLGIKVSI